MAGNDKWKQLGKEKKYNIEQSNCIFINNGEENSHRQFHCKCDSYCQHLSNDKTRKSYTKIVESFSVIIKGLI